jgi:glycosyltransferase involved in cell wall biosynthesis
MRDNTPKNIAVLGLSHPFRGGIAHYSTLLVRELRKKYSVRFITLNRQYPNFLFPGKTQYDNSNEPLHEANEPRIDSINPLTWIHTAFSLKKAQVDFVIVQWWNPFFGLAFGTIVNLLYLLSKQPTCFLCHNIVPHESTFLDKLLSKYAFLTAQYFIVHSEEDEKNLLALKPTAHIKRNPHATYSVFKDYNTFTKEEARIALNISPRKNVILFFGLVREYKGLQYIIYAMKNIITSIDCALLVVGEFYEAKDKYISLVNDLLLQEHVVIIDKYVKNEEIPVYFCSADVVVLPYVSATQSGIVQIAFGFHKPVITTNVGGLPEAVEDGKTGFIVEPKSPEQLAEAVIRYYREGCEARFSEAIRGQLDTFSWEREVANIDAFLQTSDEDFPAKGHPRSPEIDSNIRSS